MAVLHMRHGGEAGLFGVGYDLVVRKKAGTVPAVLRSSLPSVSVFVAHNRGQTVRSLPKLYCRTVSSTTSEGHSSCSISSIQQILQLCWAANK